MRLCEKGRLVRTRSAYFKTFSNFLVGRAFIGTTAEFWKKRLRSRGRLFARGVFIKIECLKFQLDVFRFLF